ncbi:hypothetical protein VNI00_013653 [Paramarasmius palmivorus]|uniref:F-box domain-containing protein n=1 Tax=Paramarasmius palmivorus TaxID=297713 RepID=A0AAW0BXK2_9AGAR
MNRLPSELKDMVFTYCDEETLKASTGVCKALHTHARNSLFTRNLILMVDGSSNRFDNMEATLASPTNGIQWCHIKRVTLVFVSGRYSWDALKTGAHITKACEILNLLKGKVDLEYLSVIVENQNAELFSYNCFTQIIQTDFPNVTRFELRLERERLEHILPVVCSFANLDTLELSCRDLVYEEDQDLDLSLALPSTLRSLHLHLPENPPLENGPIHEWLGSQSVMADLQYLSILEMGSDLGQSCLRRPDPQLRTIYIGFCNLHEPLSEDIVFQLYILSHLSRLEEIIYYLSDKPTSMAVECGVYSSLCLLSQNPGSLQSVVFVLSKQALEDLSTGHMSWLKDIDETIETGPYFSDVVLTVIVPAAYEDADTPRLVALLRSVFPRYVAAGKTFQIQTTHDSMDGSWNPLQQSPLRRRPRQTALYLT